MNQCAAQSFEASDAELNALYKEIEQRLSDDADKRRLLVESQRIWVNFRDAECSFSASGTQGGSVYPMIYATCQESITQKRIADFQEYLSCEEGDLSCPVPPAD